MPSQNEIARNAEGLTWEEWARAATLPAQDGAAFPAARFATPHRAWQSGEDPSEWRAELAARVVRDRPQATPRDLAQVSGYMICAPGEHVPNWGKDSDHFWCRHCASWVPSEEGTDDRVERALGPTCDSCTDRLLTLRRVSQILERNP